MHVHLVVNGSIHTNLWTASDKCLQVNICTQTMSVIWFLCPVNVLTIFLVSVSTIRTVKLSHATASMELCVCVCVHVCVCVYMCVWVSCQLSLPGYPAMDSQSGCTLNSFTLPVPTTHPTDWYTDLFGDQIPQKVLSFHEGMTVFVPGVLSLGWRHVVFCWCLCAAVCLCQEETCMAFFPFPRFPCPLCCPPPCPRRYSDLTPYTPVI